MVEKTILCLANSRKTSGRCIAGKEFMEGEVGPWIRPVSSRPLQEVSEHERQYENGRDPRLLDIIEIQLIRAKPKGFQTENWLLDPEYYWKKIGSVSVLDLKKWIERPRILWRNESHSVNGRNDRILVKEANSLTNSLILVAIEELVVKVYAPGADFGNPKRRVQGSFIYNNVNYEFWITDPKITSAYLNGDNGEFEVGDAYATISLAEPHTDGYAYKVIASLFI